MRWRAEHPTCAQPTHHHVGRKRQVHPKPAAKVRARVVDAVHGRPADGIAARLDRRVDGEWQSLARGHTDETGELADVFSTAITSSGVYRLELEVDAYFASLGSSAFHPMVTVAFRVDDPGDEYHIPILITPHSQQTYRSA